MDFQRWNGALGKGQIAGTSGLEGPRVSEAGVSVLVIDP